MKRRTDFKYLKDILEDNKLTILKNTIDNKIYHTIFFHDLNNIEEVLTKEIKYFLSILDIPKNYHVFIVGLGSNSYTADSVGPKTLNYINTNGYLEKLGIKLQVKITSLEPGVLGKTGIDTKRIVESVKDEIKPDLVILIDSFVTDNIKYLNKTIEISNAGLTPGSGLMGVNSEINELTLGIPVIAIGVSTAIEVKFAKNPLTFLLSTNNIDDYIDNISRIIASSINNALR